MVTKIKELFICQNCEAQYPKWQGRCDECGKWGTLSAETSVPARDVIAAKPGQVMTLGDVDMTVARRMSTGFTECDRVLGGGMVPGSLILLGGDPGVGKSTLVMHVAGFLADQKRRVLYVSGEESAQQLKSRMDRLRVSGKSLRFLAEEDIRVIEATIFAEQPEVVVLDSIQTVFDEEVGMSAGSVNQIRACTARLMRLAKERNVVIIIIGHVTKEGILGGPKTLEHMVDVVVYMEGDRQHVYRILRTAKNRFGSTAEVGVFDMQGGGLVEVKNPSLLWFSETGAGKSGVVYSAVVEGSRVFLVEVQALVDRTVFGYPLRKSVGFDANKLHLLVAVLNRHGGLNLATSDIHLNMAGGFRSQDTGLDLAVCLAVASAFLNKRLPAKTLVVGEVGLGGEIRPVASLHDRLKEAERQGFETFLAPRFSKTAGSVKVQAVGTLQEALEFLE